MKIWKRNEVWRRIYRAKIYFIDRWQQNNPSTKTRTSLLSDDIEDYKIMKLKCEERGLGLEAELKELQSKQPKNDTLEFLLG